MIGFTPIFFSYCSVLLFIFSTNVAFGKKFNYQPYPHDEAMFKKHPVEYKRYLELEQQDKGGFLPANLMLERINMLTRIVTLEPNWIDGRWVLAANHVGYASTLVDPKREAEAAFHFRESEKIARKCLQQKTDHVLCMFFLAIALAQKSSLEGLFASIANAGEILSLFKAVYKSKYDYIFDRFGSVQSSTRDALGTFMRVVPDSTLLEWFLGFRGNKADAIKYHEEAIQLIGYNSCNSIFLAVSLLCYAEELDNPKNASATRNLGTKLLKDSLYMEAANEFLANCQSDARMLLKEPGNACGYTPLKQQTKLTEGDIHDQLIR
jgi:hypothetical protein